MDADASINADNKEQLQVEETNDACKTDIIRIVSLTRGTTDRSCTTERASENWFGEIREVDLSHLEKEPHDVCCILWLVWIFTTKRCCADLCNISLVADCRMHAGHMIVSHYSGIPQNQLLNAILHHIDARVTCGHKTVNFT